jgi:hypothetical protein
MDYVLVVLLCCIVVPDTIEQQYNTKVQQKHNPDTTQKYNKTIIQIQ